MKLTNEAVAILNLIVARIETSKSNGNYFIGYKEAHDALGIEQKGETWGTSLDYQGLGDLAKWAHANGYPAVTGLIIDLASHSPKGKFYTLNSRKLNDEKWWLEQVQLALRFDWKQFLAPNSSRASAKIERRTAASVKYSAYLLVWNPESWDWKTFDQALEQFYVSQNIVRKWGCGNRKDIQPGDRLFFIKLGPNGTRGIMGSGYAESHVFSDRHWNGNADESSNFVKIGFDVLLDPVKESSLMISLEELNSDPILTTQHWQSMSSGIGIHQAVTEKLESMWLSRLDHINKRSLTAFGNNTQRYYEGKQFYIISKRYERDPAARKRCLDANGFSCIVCNFNFEQVYGPTGKDFIHVHHITPIHTRQAEYEIAPETDLCPICPNCHSMIHRKKESLTIEELKQIFLAREKC